MLTTVALKMLRDRYQNDRMILPRSCERNCCPGATHQEINQDLRQLLETVEEHSLFLQNLGRPVNQQDDFLVYPLTEKLTTETQKLRALSTPGTEQQAYDHLQKILDARPRK